MDPNYTPDDAAMQIARKLIQDAIAQGYSVSVEDDESGGDIVITKSRDEEAIIATLCTTSGDTLYFHDAKGRKVGWSMIIWSNGYDNPSDTSCGDAIDAICKGAEALANKLSEADV